MSLRDGGGGRLFDAHLGCASLSVAQACCHPTLSRLATLAARPSAYACESANVGFAFLPLIERDEFARGFTNE